MLKTLNGSGLLIKGARALSASPVTTVTGRGGRSSTSGRTVTIFGASGGLGPYLVNNLGQIGTQLILPHRCDPFHMQRLKLSSDLGQQHAIHMPNFNDTALLEECVKYSDVVINLTGSHRARLHHSFTDNNVTVTHRIAQACKNMEVPCFIHMSHINAEPNSKSRFLKAKALSEEVVLHELPESAIIVRMADCFHFYDDFSNYLGRCLISGLKIQKGATHLYREGAYTYMQPVYGPDAMAGVANIVKLNDQDRQRLYQFVGPKTYSLNEFFVAMSDITFLMYRPVHNIFSHLVASRTSENYIRYQMTSDMPAKDLPGLEDLGVEPRLFENLALKWLRGYRNFWQLLDPIDGRRTEPKAHTQGYGPSQG